MKNEQIDTRPTATPKKVSYISEYHDDETNELSGYTLSVITEDNCWPGIFAHNPFQPPFSPHAYIKSFTRVDNDDNISPCRAIKIEYVFPYVSYDYRFPKLKLFKHRVEHSALKHAMNFKQKMLNQINRQSTM